MTNKSGEVFIGFPSAGPRRNLTFIYENWCGEVGVRTVKPRTVTWAASEQHPEPQWLLEGWDVDTREDRLFAMRNMKGVRYVQ